MRAAASARQGSSAPRPAYVNCADGSMSRVTPGPKPTTWMPPISMVCETPPTPKTKLAWVAA